MRFFINPYWRMYIKQALLLFLGSGDYPQWPDYREADIPIWIVVCAIVAILLVGFILVDLACFKINRQGNQ